MAITTIESTYSPDVGSVRMLEELARRWMVSESDVLRRAIRIAAAADNPGNIAPLADDMPIATMNVADSRRFEDSGLKLA